MPSTVRLYPGQITLTLRIPTAAIPRTINLGTDTVIRHHAGTGIASTVGLGDLVEVENNGDRLWLFCRSLSSLPDNRKTRLLHERLKRELAEQPGVTRDASFAVRVMTPILTVLFMVGIALFIGASLAISSGGPQIVTTDAQNTIWVSDQSRLTRITRDSSEVAESYEYSAFQLEDGATGVAIPAPDRVLLGDYADGSIKDCDLGRMSCKRLPAFDDAANRFQGAFKFALLPDRVSLVATDARNHRAMQLNLHSDRVIDSRLQLCHPNEVLMESDGGLSIADTNHHRILFWQNWTQWLVSEPEVRWTVSNPASVPPCAGSDATVHPELRAPIDGPGGALVALPTARANHSFPTDVAPDGKGGYWLLLKDPAFASADLVRLDADGRPLLRATMATSANPTSIATVGDLLVVADPAAASLKVINSGGQRVHQPPHAGLAQFNRIARESSDAAMLNYAMTATAFIVAMLGLLYIALAARVNFAQRVLDQANESDRTQP